MVSRRLAPDATIRFATSFAEIGHPRLVLAVLPRISEVRHHGRHSFRRSAPRRGRSGISISIRWSLTGGEELFTMKYIVSAHLLAEFAPRIFTVAEAPHRSFAEFEGEVSADPPRQPRTMPFHRKSLMSLL